MPVGGSSIISVSGTSARLSPCGGLRLVWKRSPGCAGSPPPIGCRPTARPAGPFPFPRKSGRAVFVEALQVRPEELARPVAQAVRPVLQRRGAVKVHYHFRAQSCLFQHAAVFFHGGEVKTCLVREVHPLQAGPEGLPDAEDVAVGPKFADQFSLRFQGAGDGFQKSPVVRYPMEGGIGKMTSNQLFQGMRQASSTRKSMPG